MRLSNEAAPPSAATAEGATQAGLRTSLDMTSMGVAAVKPRPHGFLSLSFGSMDCVCRSEYCNASGQAVGKRIIGTQRYKHMVVIRIGGNRMGGARCMSERVRRYRRHVEGGYQLLDDLVARVDYAKDRSTLSRQGRPADYLGRTQRAGRGGRAVISVT